MIEPRAYQIKAVDQIVDFAMEHPSGGSLLISCPPGGGKTVIVALALRLLAADQGLRAVGWAHRREIVCQNYDHLIDCGIPREMMGIMLTGDVGHEHGDSDLPRRRTNPAAPVQVGTIGMIQKHKPLADILWSDEAHMDGAPGRSALGKAYPRAIRLGSTGSASRLDGRGLSDEYDAFLQVSSVSELVALGYLADPIVWTVPLELLPDLSHVRKQRGDYDLGELQKATNRRPIVGGIVDHWKRRAEGLRTFAFGVTREHAKHIARAFQAAGVPWGYVDGATAYDERQRLLDRVIDGDLMGLSCADLLTAGVDRPAIKCVIQARPTLSLVVHLQQTGRAMRPWGGVTPIILDHAGNNRRLGLPQEERDWEAIFRSAAPRAGAQRSVQKPKAKVCATCFAVASATRTKCPQCNEPFPVEPLPPMALEREGDLVRVHADEKTKTAAWEAILKVAAEVGGDEAWAMKVYETRFGERRVA